MVLFFYSIWLAPFVLTLLAWRAGLHVVARAGGSKTNVRARTWPAMLFLAAPVVMILGFVLLRVGKASEITVSNAYVWTLAIGVMSSVAALVTAAWAPRNFRLLAFCAAAGWAGCFGFVIYGFSRLGAALR